MRLGIFGGSFDPVHNGHLGLARLCLEHARLDEVWFVPAAHQPHKPRGPVASNADRVAMLRLATAEEPRFRVSTVETDRGGVSYTVDTLRTVAADRPEDELFLLMGADTLRDFPLWREPGEILRLATPVVVHRVGEPDPDLTPLGQYLDSDQLKLIRSLVVESPPQGLSSSEIRDCAANGKALGSDYLEAVANYIEQNELYRSEAD